MLGAFESTGKKAAEGTCCSQVRNNTACQLVANMCTLVLFRDDHAGSPCKVFQDSKHIPTSDSSSLPWLYYGEGDAQTVLSRKKITAKYSMDPSSKVSNLCNAAGNKFLGMWHYSLLVMCWCFRQTCCLHPHSPTLKIEAADSFEIRLHCDTSQKTRILIYTDMKHQILYRKVYEDRNNMSDKLWYWRK